jgi:hypothetical protein
MSPARATPARVPAAARLRRNETAGHGPGSVLRPRHPTALAGRTRPPAGPRAAPLQADYPLPAGPPTAQRRPRTPTGRSVRSASSCAAPDRRVGRDGSNWISPHGAVHRRITRWVSVSAVPLAVSSWGVARPGERRQRACKCSRGRRPSRSDSEATDRPSVPPQRRPSEVDGPLTRTRLRRACRLQRPCPLPRHSR